MRSYVAAHVVQPATPNVSPYLSNVITLDIQTKRFQRNLHGCRTESMNSFDPVTCKVPPYSILKESCIKPHFGHSQWSISYQELYPEIYNNRLPSVKINYNHHPSVKVKPKISGDAITGGTTTKILNLKHITHVELLTLAEEIIDALKDLFNDLSNKKITSHTFLKATLFLIHINNLTTISLSKEDVIVLYTLSSSYNSDSSKYISFDKALQRANNYCLYHNEKLFSEKEYMDILKHLEKLNCIDCHKKGYYLRESIKKIPRHPNRQRSNRLSPIH